MVDGVNRLRHQKPTQSDGTDLEEVLRRERKRTVRFVMFVYWMVAIGYSVVQLVSPNVIPTWCLISLWAWATMVTVLCVNRAVLLTFFTAGGGAVALSIAVFLAGTGTPFSDIVQTAVLMTIVGTLYFHRVYFWYANVAGFLMMVLGFVRAIGTGMNRPEMLLKLGLNGMLFWLAVTIACWLFVNKSMRLLEQLSRAHSAMMIDPLTKTYNRLYFNEAMTTLEQRYNHTHPSESLTIFMLDLDHFKRINDQYGHLVGDHVLVHFTQTIQSHIRSSDVFVRVGGEEFALVVHHDGKLDITQYADRIREAIQNSPFTLTNWTGHGGTSIAAVPGVSHESAGLLIPLTASIGGATFSPGAESIQGCINRADLALYEGKAGGRNKSVIA